MSDIDDCLGFVKKLTRDREEVMRDGAGEEENDMKISADMDLIGLRNALAERTRDPAWCALDLVPDEVVSGMRAHLASYASGYDVSHIDPDTIRSLQDGVEAEVAWRRAYLSAQSEAWRPESQGLTRAERIELGLVLATFVVGAACLSLIVWGLVR